MGPVRECYRDHANKMKRRAWWRLFGLIIVAGTAGAGEEVRVVDMVSLEAGRGDVGSDRVGVALRWDRESRWFEEGRWFVHGYYEVSVSHWSGRRGVSGNGDITAFGFTPVYVLQPYQPFHQVTPYLEVASGIYWLSQTAIGYKHFSTAMQFGDHVGFGIKFGEKNRFDLSYRFQHHSNAGIGKPNHGINFQLIRFSFTL